MDSGDEFDYADQEERSSDEDGPVQQPPRQIQRPQSRLAGNLPGSAMATSSPVQSNGLGFQYRAPPPGGYNPDDYEELPVSSEVQDIFQYILQYKPEVPQLETPLKPFIPEYIPAIGEIDEFIKVGRPDGKPDLLGLKVLDEPAAIQSDPSVLAMQLRHASKQVSEIQERQKNKGYGSRFCSVHASHVAQRLSKHKKLTTQWFLEAGTSSSATAQVAKVANPGKNGKRITDWIKSINDLHKSKPGGAVHLSNAMPDIESLMQQWPPTVEQHLHTITLPDATLDVDLATFVKIVCGVLDIPVYDNPIESLHTLFTLYLEFKNNPAFKTSLSMPDHQHPSQHGVHPQQPDFSTDSRQTVSSSSRQSGNFLLLA